MKKLSHSSTKQHTIYKVTIEFRIIIRNNPEKETIKGDKLDHRNNMYNVKEHVFSGS